MANFWLEVNGGTVDNSSITAAQVDAKAYVAQGIDV